MSERKARPGTPPVLPQTLPETRSMADVVESLAAEFDSTLGIATVVLVVRRCHRALDSFGPLTQAALLESRSRRRLQALNAIRRNGLGTAGDH